MAAQKLKFEDLYNFCTTQLGFAGAHIFALAMEPLPGHFAKVNHDGKIETVIIEELSYHNGKMDYVTVTGLNNLWSKAYTPKEIIEVLENPNREAYLREKAEWSKRTNRYRSNKTRLVRDEGEGGE